MRRRFRAMNEGAGGFLGDLVVDRFLERPGPTGVAREDHLCDGQILRWALRAVKFNICKDRMNIVCLVRSTFQVNKRSLTSLPSRRANRSCSQCR
jgi:hypothetical protein